MAATARRVVCITGASAGIGAALAVALATKGTYSLSLVARRSEKLSEVAAMCGDAQPLCVVADCSVRAEVQRVVRETIAKFGRIDIFVNNVGNGLTRMPSELTDDDVDAMMRLNVKPSLYGMQEVLPHMKERGEGHIINIGSLLGRIPLVPFRAAYSGAKHFLNALTASFRDEVHETHPNIHVSIVSPGPVKTDFGLSAIHGGPDSRSFEGGQTAEEVAEVIARVMESKESDVYTKAGMKERIGEYYSTLGKDP